MRSTYTPPIDKNIPCPPIDRGKVGGAPGLRRYVRLPLRTMEIGDSVFVPRTDSETEQLRDAVQKFINRTKTPARFSTRKWKEHNRLGTRIWRVT